MLAFRIQTKQKDTKSTPGQILQDGSAQKLFALPRKQKFHHQLQNDAFNP